MYIYYVYTTKSIGSKSVTRLLLLLLLRKKKQRYKIPSQSARDLKIIPLPLNRNWKFPQNTYGVERNFYVNAN